VKRWTCTASLRRALGLPPPLWTAREIVRAALADSLPGVR
jgi:hypothetical protein